mgnify:CR=1 FL=1
MAILPEDIKDKREMDLYQWVDTIYEYIKYMKEQLDFWGERRTAEISDITSTNASTAATLADVSDNLDTVAAAAVSIAEQLENEQIHSFSITAASSGASDDCVGRTKQSNGLFEIWVRCECTLDIDTAYQGVYYTRAYVAVPPGDLIDGGDMNWIVGVHNSTGLLAGRVYAHNTETGILTLFVWAHNTAISNRTVQIAVYGYGW